MNFEGNTTEKQTNMNNADAGLMAWIFSSLYPYKK